MNAPARTFEAKPAVRRRDTPKAMPSQGELRRMFEYDPKEGTLLWRRPAGNKRHDGYIAVRFGGKSWLAHRLIWKWLYGTEPPVIDHKDGDPSNNRIGNLRRATRSENMRNRRSGALKALPRGVFRYGSSRFYAKITTDGDTRMLGVFATVAEASAAYTAAAKLLHREFARTP